jgi:hypothetical protein
LSHVLADVRGLNRLERVGETLRAAPNELAVMAPDWLHALAPATWYERYSRRVENHCLPKTDTARLEHAATGADVNCWPRSTPPRISHGWHSCRRSQFCGGSNVLSEISTAGSGALGTLAL